MSLATHCALCGALLDPSLRCSRNCAQYRPPESPTPAPPKLAMPALECERNWTEDFGHENGQYLNGCTTCGLSFVGHKRRFTCKTCAASPEREAATTPTRQCEDCGECHTIGDPRVHPPASFRGGATPPTPSLGPASSNSGVQETPGEATEIDDLLRTVRYDEDYNEAKYAENVIRAALSTARARAEQLNTKCNELAVLLDERFKLLNGQMSRAVVAEARAKEQENRARYWAMRCGVEEQGPVENAAALKATGIAGIHDEFKGVADALTQMACHDTGRAGTVRGEIDRMAGELPVLAVYAGAEVVRIDSDGTIWHNAVLSQAVVRQELKAMLAEYAHFAKRVRSLDRADSPTPPKEKHDAK